MAQYYQTFVVVADQRQSRPSIHQPPALAKTSISILARLPELRRSVSRACVIQLSLPRVPRCVVIGREEGWKSRPEGMLRGCDAPRLSVRLWGRPNIDPFPSRVSREGNAS